MIRCHFRDPVLRQIEAGLEAGQSDDEVLEQIYAEFGSETRVEPRDEGFEMVGWIAPVRRPAGRPDRHSLGRPEVVGGIKGTLEGGLCAG